MVLGVLPPTGGSGGIHARIKGAHATGFGAALSALNHVENTAANAANAVATGTSHNLATAVAAAEKATLVLQLAAQIRDTALQAYQAISQAP